MIKLQNLPIVRSISNKILSNEKKVLLIYKLLYIYSLGDSMINRYTTAMLLLPVTVMAPVMFAQQAHAKSIVSDYGAGYDAGKKAASRSGTAFDAEAPLGHGTSWIVGYHAGYWVGYYAQQAIK
jgi:hypothetical protein